MGESRETREGGPSDRGARPLQMTGTFRLKERTHLETDGRFVPTGTEAAPAEMSQTFVSFIL
jgi:hypothetical protein